MKILAIETSCDDTCAAVIKFDSAVLKPSVKNADFSVISNIISSQVKLHSKYGGVYPTLAKREHQKNLIPVLIAALKKGGLLKKQVLTRKIQKNNKNFKILNSILEREPSLLKHVLLFLKKYQKPEISAIAVTVGPGLEPCLWTGINIVKSLSFFWKIPIIPINHIEAHIFANFIGSNSKFKTQKSKNHLFPAICLIASGGHTQLILMSVFGKYKIIGETRDDAAGECFDKAARALGLGYPGGPIISAEAKKINQEDKTAISLPRPMINQNNFDFSFSGLKTAIIYKNLKETKKTTSYKRKMCKEIQQAIIDVLIKKTVRAAKAHKAKTIILGGGVSANEELKRQLKEFAQRNYPEASIIFPQKIFSTDNAAMVGIAGYFNYKKGKTNHWDKISAKANLKIS